jgi:acetate kinase
MVEERILTVNAGSSSLKVALFDAGTPPRRLFAHAAMGVDASGDGYVRALDSSLAVLEARGFGGVPAAVGHRVVHGGPRYSASQRVTPEVLGELRRLAPLDPDHMPAEIALIEAMQARVASQVACFDTAFHRTMPRTARLLPIPLRYEAEGLQRYGFHGLSYTFLIEQLARDGGDAAARGRVVMAHLGSGSSLAAVLEGRCVDTTMGYTPNSGVPMGTRSGDLDPGVLLHWLRVGRLDAAALDDLVSRRSGLLGLSETTADVRDLLARETSDPRAADAVAVYCHHVRKAVGALAATLGGVDTLIFSGGIGENAAAVRARIADGLAHVGIRLDAARNAASAAVISADSSVCTVRVIRTDEESIIARETIRAMGGKP